MPKKRRADEDDDDPEYAHHLGQFAMGDVTQLTDKAYEEGQARPRNYQDTNIGFHLTPAKSSADRIRRRKRK
jgi:hypothetical protein